MQFRCSGILRLNLACAVQLSVDLAAHLTASRDIPAPDTTGQTFDALASAGLISPELAGRMKKVVGVRNIVIHDDAATDWHIGHGICQRNLGGPRDFAAC